MAKSEKKYRVTKPWGKRKRGEILSESREVRRKLQEGGCVEEIKSNSDEIAPSQESQEKMQPKGGKNKMDLGKGAKDKGGAK